MRSTMNPSKLSVTAVVLMLMSAVTGALMAFAAPAHACSIEFETVDTEVLTAADPQAAFAASWAAYDPARDPADAPTLAGAYRHETVAQLPATADWNPGGVVSRTRAWGSATTTAETVVRHGDGDECGSPSGKSVGTVEFFVTTSGETYHVSLDDPQKIESSLSTAFGDPTEVDRDTDAEEQALEDIRAERGTSVPPTMSGNPVVILVVIILVALFAVIGRYLMTGRNRRQSRASATG